jgi:hypothetical protein
MPIVYELCNKIDIDFQHYTIKYLQMPWQNKKSPKFAYFSFFMRNVYYSYSNIDASRIFVKPFPVKVILECYHTKEIELNSLLKNISNLTIEEINIIGRIDKIDDKLRDRHRIALIEGATSTYSLWLPHINYYANIDECIQVINSHTGKEMLLIKAEQDSCVCMEQVLRNNIVDGRQFNTTIILFINSHKLYDSQQEYNFEVCNIGYNKEMGLENLTVISISNIIEYLKQNDLIR